MDELPMVERSVTLPVTSEAAWTHLIKGELASLWMEGEMSISARIGGKVTLKAEGLPSIFGTVEDVHENESITWVWRAAESEPTQVSLRLAATMGGSELTVREQMIPYEIVHVPPYRA